MPIRPTCAPPYTRPRPASPSRRPKATASARYSGCTPGLDAQKTQTLRRISLVLLCIPELQHIYEQAAGRYTSRRVSIPSPDHPPNKSISARLRAQPLQHLLDKLNPQQRAAVEAVDGPLLILAGAGSGKTRVITHRIAYLIQVRGVAPDAIMAVTFTNKAAAEMAERVDKLLEHRSLAKPLVATFHSFCVRVLRRDIEALRIGGEGLTRNFVIYDEVDQQAIVKQAMRRMGLDTKQLTPRTVLSRISWAKNHMLDPQEIYLQSTDPVAE